MSTHASITIDKSISEISDFVNDLTRRQLWFSPYLPTKTAHEHHDSDHVHQPVRVGFGVGELVIKKALEDGKVIIRSQNNTQLTFTETYIITEKDGLTTITLDYNLDISFFTKVLNLLAGVHYPKTATEILHSLEHFILYNHIH